MEGSFLSVAVSCAAIALFYVWKFLNWIWFKPRRLEKRLRQQGFKGNSYKLLFGDFKEMRMLLKEAKSKPMSLSDDFVPRVLPTLLKIVENYGENCFMWLGPKPAVIIMEPEIIKQVLSKNYIFQKLSISPEIRLVGRAVGSYEEGKWAKHRKILNPAFHVEKLKCSDMLDKWEKIVPDEGSCEFDVWPYLQAMTGDVISRTAFGSNYDKGRKILELQKEKIAYIVETSRSTFIPELRFIPTKTNRRMKEIENEIDSSVMKIINKRIKAMEAGEGSNNDLLDLLLESNFEDMKLGGEKAGISLEEVIQECKLFYFAGSDTTSVLLVWTMILLSKHKDWQARARDEVLQVFGREKLDHQQLNHLKVMTMILNEVLRLYPPAIMLGRTIHRETTLGNFTLPSGVQLILPTILLHQDNNIWGDDAKEFNPERFSEGVSNATKGKLIYFPFGWGPRVCIGQNYAMMEAKMAMAMILQRYSFELSPSYLHAPHMVITLQPQHGAQLIVQK